MADNYTVTLQFNSDFLDTYNKIKDFENHYHERLIKIQSMPESSESEQNDKDEELAKLQVEFLEISGIMFTKDSYDVCNFHDEILLEMNTYSKYDKANGVFVFPDSFSPLYVFSYISKIYPNFLDYLQTFKFTKDGTVVIDFLKLK